MVCFRMKYNSRFNSVRPHINYGHPCPNYRFTKKIGDGSASKIYKCQRTASVGDNELCIIKVIHKSEEWKAELNILKMLKKSDRILGLMDHFISDRFVYIVTQFYEGFDLFDHIDLNVPLSEEYSLKLLREMAICVKECHDQNIAHLDIKCENFMVRKMDPPQLVLIDFGHAEFIDKKQIKQGYSKYGTCFYLCPEGYFNYYSSKSDIWSLGICLYLFITGDYPFYGDDDEYEKNVVNKNIKIDLEKLSPLRSPWRSHATQSVVRSPTDSTQSVVRSLTDSTQSVVRSLTDSTQSVVQRILDVCLNYNPKERATIEELIELLPKE